MTASEGIDLENLVEQDDGTISIWPNITRLMAIFYRPVTSYRKREYKIWRLEFGKKKLRYTIERYAIKHQDNHEVFRKMNMQAVNALTVFFYQFVRDMWTTTNFFSQNESPRKRKSKKMLTKRKWKHTSAQIGTVRY